MSTPRKTGLPKDWSKKIFDNRVVNRQHHRDKNVIPGTTELKRRDNTPVSNKKVGNGRYNEGDYIGGYLGPKKYAKKSGNKNINMFHLMENVRDFWPESKPKKPVSGHWKPGR